MKKTMIPFVVSLYTLDLIFFLLMIDSLAFLANFYIIILIVSLIFGILNVIFALAFRNKETGIEIYKQTMIFKLVLIPFHIITYCIAIIIIIGGVFSVVTLFWLASLPLILIGCMMFAFSYFVIVCTSPYSVVKLIKNCKKENIVFTIITSILHFVPCVDVFNSIYIYTHYNKPDIEIVK